jgi:hypothetical protein
MPSGACVLRYEGARGVVWRVKYRDATGKQVMETIGREADGVTRESAEIELRDRLTRVGKGHWRRPAPLTFASETWYAEALSEKSWAKATTAQYESIRRRLVDSFGHKRLEEIRPSDVSAYKRTMLDEGYSGASVSRDLSILHSIIAWAVVTERMDRNPADGVPHPTAAKRKELGLPLRALRRGSQGRLRGRWHVVYQRACGHSTISAFALMTKAGHASMATTRRYLRLAGTVFPEEAAALEARVLSGNFLPEPSTDLSESEPSSRDLTGSRTVQLHAPA